MAKKKPSMKRGTLARKARGKVAESLKRRGRSASRAFALSTYIVQRAGPAGRKRLARRGLRRRK